jgi:hypothetical protein
LTKAQAQKLLLIFQVSAAATPTATVVPTVTSASTATATVVPTVTATATQTAVQTTSIKFSVQFATVGYGSAKLSIMLHRPSLTHVKVGQKIKFILYDTLSGIKARTPIVVGYRVMISGKTAYSTRKACSLAASDSGHIMDWSMFFTPKHAGTRTFTDTFFVGKKQQHKSVSLAVAAA